MSAMTPLEPALVTFLARCAVDEPDYTKRETLAALIAQWHSPAADVQEDHVWELMTYASRAYKDAPGYQDHWDR